MQDKDRERRRTKRLEKTKKKRSNVSRPGLGGPPTAASTASGRTWAPGECYVSMDWDEPGATVELVFSRNRADGATVAALFELDRSGPGLVSSRALGGMRQEHVAGECVRFSEKTGRSMVACSPKLVASLVNDAKVNGTNPVPPGFADAFDLLNGIRHEDLPVPFGLAPAPTPEQPAGEGWLGGVRKRLFGG